MRLTLPPSEPAQVAVEIVARLRAAGHQALLVGGCVRSLCLGEEPKDYDVATSARPEEIQRLFPRTVPVGVSFGVVVVRLRGISTEVATFRADGRYIDRRRPESVTFADAHADARRRDFTINALFLDPLAPPGPAHERGQGGETAVQEWTAGGGGAPSGEVIDLVGGLGDLQRRLVRTVGDPTSRFEEDALRLLRAVRFAARCDFRIEVETWRALCALAPTITAISGERIGEELIKMLTGPHAGRGLLLLEESGLLAEILPEVAAMRGVEQPPEFHPEGDVLTHTALCLDHLPPDPSPALALGALLHDVGKPLTFERAPDRIRFSGHEAVGAELTRAIGRRLRLPTALTERVVDLVRQHMRFKDVLNMRPATLKRFLFQEHFEDHAALHRCDALGSLGTGALADWCLERRAQLAREGESRLPPPLLRGDDLIAMGFPPGPIFREILEAVQTEQLEGRLRDSEDARAFVIERWPPPLSGRGC